MTDRQIISLLKRYMDGATTVEEETALTEFFCTATDADRPDAISAADWSAYREMFCMFAPERAEKDLQNEAAAPTVQRFTLRKAALWVASVAAVAVLVFAVSALLPDNTPPGQSSGAPLAQQAARLVPADSIADSISAEQPQRILADSVKQQPGKRRLHKSLRPYWQPRPPKVYVAEADRSASTHADSMRRHAYLAVWFKDSSKFHCYYYHIYGVMPARFKEFKSGVRGAKPINKGSMLRTQTVLDDNGVTTTTYDNDGNVRVFNSRSFSSAMANEVNNDIDFMLLFGNLRAAFLDAIKDADAKTLQTGIVVKIARLCREHSKLLTDNEKQTCTSIIDEMKSTLKKVNPDTFMDGVLQEARIAVAK